jgi:hypothetical protein
VHVRSEAERASVAHCRTLLVCLFSSVPSHVDKCDHHRDILTGLVSIGDSTLPAYRPSDKRKHPGGDPSASSPETPSSLSTPPDIAEAPAQAYEPAQHGSLLVGYGLAGFRPMQDATSIGHTQDDRLDLHTESSTSLGLDYLFELGLLETPDPTQAWWPDLGIQFPATLATGLSQDKVSPHGASRDLNPPLSFQPDGVLSADAMQPLSGQPTFSWPGVPDPFQCVRCPVLRRGP